MKDTKVMLGKEIANAVVWPTSYQEENLTDRVFVFLSEHDEVVKELKKEIEKIEAMAISNENQFDIFIAHQAKELEIARVQIAKLREQRNEVILKTSTWPTTDALHEHYEIELEEYIAALKKTENTNE